MPEAPSGTSPLLTDPDRFNVQWWSYDDWALWRFEDMETLSPVSLEKVQLPDPERFDISGTEFSSAALFRAIHTMGGAEKEKGDGSVSETPEGEDPEARLKRVASYAEKAVSHLETLNAEPGEGGNIDAISDFIGKDRDNLTGARKTLQDLLTGDHEVSGIIEKHLAEGVREERDSFAEGVAHRLARLLLSYYMRAVADAFREFAAKEVEMESAPETEDNPLSNDELIGVPRSQKGSDLEELYWEGAPPAPCQKLVDEYLEGRSLEGLAGLVAYPMSIQLASQAFDEVDGDPPSDGEIENYVQSLSGKSLFNHAVKLAVRVVAFGVLECLEDEGLSADRIEELLDVEAGGPPAETPTPKPETPEFDPSPFQGDGETAGILSGPFSSAVGRALVETPDEAASQPGHYEKEWGADSTGHPIRVEELHGQYSGRVTLRVQAYGEPDPTAVDAEMGWAMLQEMEMEEVWLHAFLLAHASAPGRRGDRKVIRIPRVQIERLPMGFRSRNRSKWERAEKIKEHIDRLRSVFVQFQNVERHGDKLRFRHDMNATPLWSLRMVAEGEKDLFTGEEWSEWYLEAREGMWAEEFLHNHGEQWAPLPKEWFEQIDRRGSDWGQRLAVLLLFLFRTNRKQGGRVKLSAEKMLQACGVDLSVERDSSDRYDLKQKLSSALEDLHHNYGMRVQDGDVNMSKIDGRSYWTNWKNQTVTIDPPEKIDRRLLSGEGPERAPLPDTRPGRWSKKQIERLLNELGWTQKRLASELPVGKQSVSHYLNNRRAPSDNVRAALDRIQARHL